MGNSIPIGLVWWYRELVVRKIAAQGSRVSQLSLWVQPSRRPNTMVSDLKIIFADSERF